MRRVLHHILTIRKFGHLPPAMCYDCACTLKPYIGKHFGTDDLKSTNNTQFLMSLSMAIDRFHVLNHKRAMFQTVMRPDHPCHKGVYESINTEVAEQLFSYLSKFKRSFRAYNYPKSTIFFPLLFHLKNCSTTGIHSFERSVQYPFSHRFLVHLVFIGMVVFSFQFIHAQFYFIVSLMI